MRRTVLMLLALAVVLSAAAAVDAATTYVPYHRGDKLVCSDCHVMHGSLGHASPSYSPSTVEKLLKVAGGGGTAATNTTNLCLACHGTGAVAAGAPGVTTVTTGTNRSAGSIDESAGTTGHYVNVSGTAPGGDGSYSGTLTCTSCHQQHGANSAATYRNLKPSPNSSSFSGTIAAVLDTSVTTGGSLTGYDVVLNSSHQATNPPTWSQGYYEAGNVFYGEPGPGTSNSFSKFCANCHIGFDASISSPAIKHPSAMSVNLSGSTGNYLTTASFSLFAKVPVTRQTYAIATGGTDGSPFCLSCHKAHGNANAYGLILADRSQAFSTYGEDGTTSGNNLTNLCSQCHTTAN